MRFKKVEISAFRIYDKPEDATFDFTLKGDKIASFVSLYAPNGFGKTSFYDAVEWGMTDNIQRFWQNDMFAEAMHLEKGSSDEQVKILRNTSALKSRKSFVKITTDESETNRILKAHGNKKWDIADCDSYENKAFRKVILSQEWIATFLKEVDSGKRFSLFMENPELAGLNTYYRNITDLLGANTAVMTALITDIENEKSKIVEIEEGNLLETINASIKGLQDKDEQLTSIELTTTGKEALELVNLVTARRVIIGDRVRSAAALLDLLGIALSGNKDISGVILYFEQRERKGVIVAKIVSVDRLLQVFAELEKCLIEEKSRTHHRVDNFKAIEQLDKIRTAFAGYEATMEAIKMKEIVKIAEHKSLSLSQHPLAVHRNNHAELLRKLNYNFSQLVDLEAKVKNYPTLKLAYEILRENLANCDLDSHNLTRELSELTTELKQIQQQIASSNSQLDHLKSGDYGRLMKTLQEAHQTRIKNLLQKKESFAYLTDTINELNQKISRQQSFNKEIEDFVKMGLDLINDSQTSECPLCNQKYESYSLLASKVAANTLLDAALQELIATRTQKQTEIAALNSETAIDDEAIAESIRRMINSLNEYTTKQKQLSDNLNNELKLVNNRRSKNKSDLDGISAQIAGETLENYLQNINSSIKKLQLLQETLTVQLKEVDAAMTPLVEANQISGLKIKLLDDDIALLKLNQDYIAILGWFKANEGNTTPVLKAITARIDDLLSRNEAISVHLAELGKIHVKLEKDVSAFDHKQLLAEKKRLTTDRELIVKSIAKFETFIDRFMNVDAANMDSASLTRALEEIRAQNQEKIKQQKELDTAYETLVKYVGNLLPYLQSENARLKIINLQGELAQLEKYLLPMLEAEKKAVRTHLEEKIKSFFYTGLINQIYNKIDPHPDFKAVEFKANFDAPTPTLDVFVANDQREQAHIPNLYFSSAQINILSLSIFLASALNSKEYDCIFIDDPIQSMDSINVLSTIDLLRSIVVNENKQIIISTHDANFHNLLKKKMPPKLFSSKFLELESFGKVKESL